MVKQIHPKYFRYNGKKGISDTTALQIGIIGQEIVLVAPYIVDTIYAQLNPEDSADPIVPMLMVSNEPLFFAAINAIKELAVKDSVSRATIDSLKQKDSITDARIQQLEELMNECCSIPSARKANSTGQAGEEKSNVREVELTTDVIILDQNNPNPFKETTAITYFIPDFVNYAQIIFSDNMGRVIKTVDVTEKGQGKLEVKAEKLNSGIYTYSIVIDGQIVDSKKMIRTK